MNSKKSLQVIESIKNMSDKEADVLEVFIAGFRSGMQTSRREMENQQLSKPSETKKPTL